MRYKAISLRGLGAGMQLVQLRSGGRVRKE